MEKENDNLTWKQWILLIVLIGVVIFSAVMATVQGG